MKEHLRERGRWQIGLQSSVGFHWQERHVKSDLNNQSAKQTHKLSGQTHTHTHTSHVIVHCAANYAARTWGNAKSHIYIRRYTTGISTQNANTCKNIHTKTQLPYSPKHTVQVHLHSHPARLKIGQNQLLIHSPITHGAMTVTTDF